MPDIDTHDVEIHIDEAKKMIAFGDAISRLIANKDFQAVIDDGYTTKETRRLAMLLGDPSIDKKEPIYMSLQAIGELHQYLRFNLGLADQMRKEVEQAEQYLDEVAENAAEGGDE